MTAMRAPSSELPIELRNVSVVARGNPILEDVSLTFAAGAPTVLIGPNGAGKTTLLRILMGLIQPVRGRVTWGGRDDINPGRCAIVFCRPARDCGEADLFCVRCRDVAILPWWCAQ